MSDEMSRLRGSTVQEKVVKTVCACVVLGITRSAALDLPKRSPDVSQYRPSLKNFQSAVGAFIFCIR